MKRIGYLLLMVILASCSSKQEQDKLNDENVAVVQKYIKAVQEKDTKTMTDLLTDDYTGYGPSITDSVNKSQAIESWKELSENLYDKIEYIKSVNVAAYVPIHIIPATLCRTGHISS
jgi:lipoate synthase